MIGGWRIQYLKEFHRLTFNDTTDTIQMDPTDGAWQQLLDMNDARWGHLNKIGVVRLGLEWLDCLMQGWMG
jgi:hypothetical protein